MFYSFVVRSNREVPLPEHLLVIGEGLDTFNATVKDLNGFLQKLREEGVEVIKVFQLDGLEAVPPELPGGEEPPLLG